MIIKEISVIIPCFNEQNRILETLIDTIYYCDRHFKNYEIIIVNDGSTDETAEIIKETQISVYKNKVKLISYEPNQGKGFAVRLGLLSAKYDYALFMDADGSTKIEEIEKLDQYIKDYELVIGSRNLETSVITQYQTPMRIFSGKMFSKLTQFILKTKIKDTQCGFKLFYMPFMEKILGKCKINRFSFDAEIIFLTEKNKLNIKEVGIIWENDINTKVHFLRDSTRMLYDLIRIRLQ